jgi:hypothetical protein
MHRFRWARVDDDTKRGVCIYCGVTKTYLSGERFLTLYTPSKGGEPQAKPIPCKKKSPKRSRASLGTDRNQAKAVAGWTAELEERRRRRGVGPGRGPRGARRRRRRSARPHRADALS